MGSGRAGIEPFHNSIGKIGVLPRGRCKIAGYGAGEYHQGHGEDQRDHARHVNAQRYIGGPCLTVHLAAPESRAGILHRYAAVSFGENND